jgi:hypothetical protein
MPESGQEKAKQPEDSAPGSSPADQLSFIGKFIDRYYLKQSTWVQSITFLVFVLLFAYGFYNSVSGTRVIKGSLWVDRPQSACSQRQGSCSTFASYYEIRWGTRDFVSNSRGEYNVTIGFGEYIRLLASGSHEITFLKDGQKIAAQTLKLNRLDGEFVDVTLPANATNDATTASAGDDDFSFVPSVFASTPDGKYRVTVEGVRFSGGAAKADAELILVVEGNTIPLKDRLHDDALAGHIPLAADRNLDLGSSYYFPVPNASLPIKAQLKLVTPGGLFQLYSNREEEFQLPSQQAVGQPLQLKGSNGSVLTVRVTYGNEVKLFRQSDIAAGNDRVEPDFLDQGLLVRWSQSPLGKAQNRETNALWTGRGVPFDVVQRLLQVALNEKIALKKVQYQYTFQSTSNPNEIQFGSSPTCLGGGYAVIPESTLRSAIDSKTEDDFKKIIAQVNDCKAAAPARSAAARRARPSR